MLVASWCCWEEVEAFWRCQGGGRRSGAERSVTKGLPVYVTGARGSPRLSRVDGELIAISYLTKMACQPHLRSAFPHAYQGYACVSCVPGSPRYPHPLTRLCVWRLPPARLLVDPGVPGSTFHTLELFGLGCGQDQGGEGSGWALIRPDPAGLAGCRRRRPETGPRSGS